MASTIMHLAIAYEIINQIQVDDNNRFYVGSILPDAATNSNSHYRIRIHNNKKSIMDTNAFYQQFKDKIPFDGLYLGYYFHLMEDVLFRNVLYYDLNFLKYRGAPNFVEELHMDYWILNCYLVYKYRLVNNLTMPKQFEKERLNTAAEFDLESFLSNSSRQFTVDTKKETKHFSQKSADNYIKECAKICLSEYNSLKQGKVSFRPENYAWG